MPPIRLYFNDTQTFLFLLYFFYLYFILVSQIQIYYIWSIFFSNYSHRIFNLLLHLEITRILI